MSWRDTITRVEKTPTSASSWRDTIEAAPTPAKEPISAGQSALGGALSSASLGFRDELSGLLEALGSKVGVRGLGGSFSDIRKETAEEDALSFADVYKQATEAKRQMMREEQEANPQAYLAGELAAGFALPASGTKTLGQYALKGAGLGGASGFGAGEGLEESLKRAAIGAPAGAVISAGLPFLSQKASDKISALGQKYTGVNKPERDIIAKTANKLIGGVSEEQTQRYIDRNKAVREAIEKKLKPQDLSKELASDLMDARKAISKASTQSYETLAKNKTAIPAKDVLNLFEDRLANLKSAGFKDSDLINDINYLQNLKGQLTELSPSGQSLDFNLPGKNVKELLTMLDNRLEKAYIENAASKRTPGSRALKSLRGEISEQMKELDPEYAAQMGDIAKQTEIVKQAAQTFAKPKTGMQALKRIGRDKDPFAEEALSAFDKLKKTDYVERAKDIATGEIMRGQSTQGSRNVQFGRSVLGKIPVVGEAIGGAVGYIGDKYGRPGVAKAIDWSLISRKMPEKYRRALEYGAEKSSNAAAVNHYLLYNQDPNYRKAFEDAQQEVDRGQ